MRPLRFFHGDTMARLAKSSAGHRWSTGSNQKTHFVHFCLFIETYSLTVVLTNRFLPSLPFCHFFGLLIDPTVISKQSYYQASRGNAVTPKKLASHFFFFGNLNLVHLGCQNCHSLRQESSTSRMKVLIETSHNC